MTLLLSLPADLEVWLLLGYVIVVLAGARLTEALARVHFERARRYAERGFEYDADADHYHCPQGERLALHLVEPREPAGRLPGTGVELQRLPAEGVLHAARRGPAPLPPPGGLGRDGRRPVPPVAVAADGRECRCAEPGGAPGVGGPAGDGTSDRGVPHRRARGRQGRSLGVAVDPRQRAMAPGDAKAGLLGLVGGLALGEGGGLALAGAGRLVESAAERSFSACRS